MLRVAIAWLVAATASVGVHAEPYLAVQTGLRCAACHVNQTGGGARNPFGNQFAQGQLAANRLPGAASAWDGRVGSWLGVGANARAAAVSTEIAGSRETEQLDLHDARVYLQFGPVAERFSLYVDQYLGPGASTNREAFVLYRPADGSHYLKAGRLYLPFGWRLQDNSAFVRAESAIDMIGPDRGVEVGWDRGALSLQFAVSNGTFGERDDDDRKQYSLQLQWVESAWRVGAAANFNDRAIGDRSALGLFGGLRTGPVAWLAEIDAIEDRSSPRTVRAWAWLAEGNWRVAQGHNLKLTLEGLDPDRARGGDRQTRLSALYEYTPVGFVQLRGGLRRYDGPSSAPVLNRRVVFVEVHGFF